MPNPEQLDRLKDIERWNEWRREHFSERVDLSGAELHKARLSKAMLVGADLAGANLVGADLEDAYLPYAILDGARLEGANLKWATLERAYLRGAHLNGANLDRAGLGGAHLEDATLIALEARDADFGGAVLRRARLAGASLEGANFTGADLEAADLTRATLTGAQLERAFLKGADLRWTDLRGTRLNDANLEASILVDTHLEGADLGGCHIYGISAWDVHLDGAKQTGLVITEEGHHPVITVDELDVAQFIYLVLNNKNIGRVIHTIGEKGVLILGRFTPERKTVLDAMRARLREVGFVPMLFDFEKATRQDFTDTIRTLAGLSRFIIADITNPKSSPLELQAIVPDYMVPLVPILLEDEKPFSMFADLQNKYDWVLTLLKYDTVENLLNVFDAAVVRPALEKAEQLVLRKAETIRERHVSEYRDGRFGIRRPVS